MGSETCPVLGEGSSAAMIASELSGRCSSTDVPSPGSLVSVMVPRWARTIDATMARPSPLPSPAGRVVKKGSKA